MRSASRTRQDQGWVIFTLQLTSSKLVNHLCLHFHFHELTMLNQCIRKIRHSKTFFQKNAVEFEPTTFCTVNSALDHLATLDPLWELMVRYYFIILILKFSRKHCQKKKFNFLEKLFCFILSACF